MNDLAGGNTEVDKPKAKSVNIFSWYSVEQQVLSELFFSQLKRSKQCRQRYQPTTVTHQRQLQTNNITSGYYYYYYYYICLMAFFPRTTWVSRHQKGTPLWISLQQRWWGGSGISWTICKSFAPRSRQITMPVPHHSVFIDRMPFLLPNQQRQSTEGKHFVLLRNNIKIKNTMLHTVLPDQGQFLQWANFRVL